MIKKSIIARGLKMLTAITLGLILSTTGIDVASAADMSNGADNFYRSDKLTMERVVFKNQYKMDVVGNLFIPKDMKQNVKKSAIIVGHPMGAVKEQSANLYAQKMADQGYVTLSLDLTFWGESEGQPRNAVLPDIYTEDFSAAVDFLGTRPFVDRERIGAIGICGSGSFVISAAKIDPRIKAVSTISMYDMGAANRNALNHSQTLEERKKIIAEAAEQRYVEFTGGETKYTSGTVNELKEDTHPIQKEFFDFYRTSRGQFTPQGSTPELTTHPTLTSNVKFMNFYPFNDIETISPRPMLFIAGENAHSREFSEDAYKLAAEPKELYIVPGAGHVDLYDRVNLIPFEKLNSFFFKYLVWDKTFDPSDKVSYEKVSYKNRYGINISADLYIPKNIDKSNKYQAIVVGTPYGGVKEQGAGLYAQTMAERGFVVIAFDESYNGESSGEPRHVSSPDIFTEDFSAGVDYLGTLPYVDREKIGAIGICGSGGFAITAAQVDHRIKAVATASMYDMSRVKSNGWLDSMTEEQRNKYLDQLGEQRWKDVDNGAPQLGPQFPDKIPSEGLDPITSEFFEYYVAPRGHHPNSIGTFTITSDMSFMNFPLLDRIKSISPRPILLIMGENAHSRYFSEDAYKMAAEPKELYVVKGARHIDLYDKKDLIPFDKLETFFKTNLK